MRTPSPPQQSRVSPRRPRSRRTSHQRPAPPRPGRPAHHVRAHLPVGLPRQAVRTGLLHRPSRGRHRGPVRRRRLDQRRQPHRGIPEVRRGPLQGLLQRHRRSALGRLALHARPARHRRDPDLSGSACGSARRPARCVPDHVDAVALPPANNPVLDEHILGAISMAVLGLPPATSGGSAAWGTHGPGRKYPVLR